MSKIVSDNLAQGIPAPPAQSVAADRSRQDRLQGAQSDADQPSDAAEQDAVKVLQSPAQESALLGGLVESTASPAEASQIASSGPITATTPADVLSLTQAQLTQATSAERVALIDTLVTTSNLLSVAMGASGPRLVRILESTPWHQRTELVLALRSANLQSRVSLALFGAEDTAFADFMVSNRPLEEIRKQFIDKASKFAEGHSRVFLASTLVHGWEAMVARSRTAPDGSVPNEPPEKEAASAILAGLPAKTDNIHTASINKMMLEGFLAATPPVADVPAISALQTDFLREFGNQVSSNKITLKEVEGLINRTGELRAAWGKSPIPPPPASERLEEILMAGFLRLSKPESGALRVMNKNRALLDLTKLVAEAPAATGKPEP